MATSADGSLLNFGDRHHQQGAQRANACDPAVLAQTLTYLSAARSPTRGDPGRALSGRMNGVRRTHGLWDRRYSATGASWPCIGSRLRE